MSQFKLDRIRFKWKGPWTSATAYVKDDIMEYAGSSYVCKVGHTSSSVFVTDFGTFPQENIVEVRRNTGDNANVYYFNGVERPSLVLHKGLTYTFNLDDLSNVHFPNADGGAVNAHPLLFSKTADGTLVNSGFRYEDGITYYINKAVVSAADYIANFATATYREIRIEVPLDAINLYYFCNYHSGMGTTVDVSNTAKWEHQVHGNVYKNDWAISTIYNIGDIVVYGGNIWVCINYHTSTAVLADGLESDITHWQQYSYQDEYRSNWVTGVRYKLNDIVRNNGTLYRCITHHTSAATVELGIEADLAKWIVVSQQVNYLQSWTPSTNYKIFDLVKVGASVWKCETQHISDTFQNDYANWSLYLDGLEWENAWDAATYYQIGDTIDYGGYSYRAKLSNINIKPQAADTATWQQVSESYDHKGEYAFDSSQIYQLGDVVRHNGYLYVAISDSQDVVEPPSVSHWQVIIPGRQWRGQWAAANEYKLEDLATIGSDTYICNSKHLSVAGNSPLLNATLWTLHAQGKATNVLSTKGDIITYADDAANLNKKRFSVGSQGAILRSLDGTALQWDNVDLIPQVFYVAPSGTDSITSGKSLSSPFRTIKFACDYIQSNVAVDTINTSILVKTGIYSEILPISVPKNCAVIGDELRSTIVQPASGYTSSKMFYLRDGSGMRNLTMQGLLDELGLANAFLTKRPTNDAAYVSLDPGTGPSDTTVWITGKSPYVQNVTTIGSGCTGMKIDGALHAGGNDSIVANDFTQILTDGIGVWVTNLGRSELVSVFTYYNHIGYLSEAGGKIRGANGNNSYGTYGSVAEGVDANETPSTTSVTNRSGEAIVSNILTDGNEILVFEYDNAGEGYDTTATYTITGAGQNAAISASNFRNGGIYQVRLTGLTANPVGASYLQVEGNAQDGGSTAGTIILSGADVNAFVNYDGMRLVVISGAGAGQYGYITAYVPATKNCTINQDTSGNTGWDHFTGATIVAPDATSRYRIEPRVTISAPVSGTQPIIRAFIAGGFMSQFRIIEPGSGYTVGGTAPTITITDPNNTSEAAWEVRVGNGVLAQPTWSNRGENYLTAFSTAITGTGYADQYSLGRDINVSALTVIPGPGANLEFTGDSTFYSVTEVKNLAGAAGSQTATLSITPYLKANTSPTHTTGITIRENFSQVRLTGHDFLDVGTGGFATTQYPARYVDGYSSDNNPSQEKEAAASGGGRVFYTSTDQDGNFRVGELFKVEQASGVITLNADDFQLTGLTELRLGGVSLGGTSAVVREFSTDRTFAANADTIVPTQKAINLYIEDQIGGGGADVVVSGLVAGQTNIINGNEISSATTVVNFPNQMNFEGGVDGDMLRAVLFIQGNA